MRTQVKGRTRTTDKYTHGYFITVPAGWFEEGTPRFVKVYPEGKEDEAVKLQIKHGGNMTYVSVDGKWADKWLIAELIEKKKG